MYTNILQVHSVIFEIKLSNIKPHAKHTCICINSKDDE